MEDYVEVIKQKRKDRPDLTHKYATLKEIEEFRINNSLVNDGRSR